MSSSEAMSAGVLIFSFTHHSCFIRIIHRMVLKCSSLSFLAASSLSFCALIYWILLLGLGVSSGGHQRGAGSIPGAVVFEIFFCPQFGEIRWSGLPNWIVRFGCYWESTLASVLVFAFSSRPFSAPGFALSLLAEASLPDPA
jgi:hypothetical protein